MTNKNILKKLFILLFFSIYLQNIFCAEKSKWIIASQKFDFAKGQEDVSVNKALSETIPVSILEKLSSSLERNVYPDELYNRESKTLLKERQSLFLQLSSAIKKRDSYVVQNLSEKSLQAKIKEEDKKIQEIQKQIDDSVKKQNELIQQTEEKLDLIEKNQKNDSSNELELYKNLFKNIFSIDSKVIQQEQITFYNNDFSALYNPSEKVSKLSPLDADFEEEINAKNINSLLTGTITKYGDYINVKVEVILYPNAKVIGSVNEIGSINELDFICSSLATQIIPVLTNSMPVDIKININPVEAQQNVRIYFDDILFQNAESFVLQSGVHNVQFVSDRFKTASTNYYFEGNTQYLIEVNLEEKKEGNLTVGLVKPVLGEIFANGEAAAQQTGRKSSIKINGNNILGEFISEDGENAFFYIPEKMVFENNFVSINPKTFDREKYIDTRRRWMYGSYSLLILSLIPTFITTGELQNTAKLYTNGLETYEKAQQIQTWNNIFCGISIGCGVLFVFEIVRYFIAANSVLPQKAKNVPLIKQNSFDESFMVNQKNEMQDNQNNDIKDDLNDEINSVSNSKGTADKIVSDNNENFENIKEGE